MVLLPNFLKNNADMLDAAERCIGLRQHLPSLVLMYSHIDALAWAASKKSGTDVRLTFEAWTNRWLLPYLMNHAPNVTSTDLYGARCGVMHTLTGRSALSGKGHAREIAYAWGTGEVELLREAFDQVGKPVHIVAIHYQELLKCLRSAVADFIASADHDADLAAALEAADSKHYVNLPISRSGAE